MSKEEKLPVSYAEAVLIYVALERYSEEIWNEYKKTEKESTLKRYERAVEINANINSFLMKCERDFGLHEGVRL